jgi:GNAT superfamily N-acetyltransferase
MNEIEFKPVQDDATRAAAQQLVREYLEAIAREAADTFGLVFDIDAMVAADFAPGSGFDAPNGRFYLVLLDGAPVGIGALKPLSDEAAELQRMYVRAGTRGLGLGRRLLERLLADCRALGFATVRLESLKFLAAAHALYHSAGFVDVPPYEDHGMSAWEPEGGHARYLDSVVFMEMRLR